MKKVNKLLTALSLITIITSCAKIYQTEDAIPLAQSHKIIAIIPPSVSINTNKKIDGDVMKEQQKTESLNFQKEIYSWLLTRKSQGKIMQEVMDVETTNAKLNNAGFNEKSFTQEELCKILGVDGIIVSNFALSKPMSEGAAIVFDVLGSGAGATNEVRVSMTITDCSGKKIIWNYDHKYSGGIGSSPSRLVETLMREASKKMPYFVRK